MVSKPLLHSSVSKAGTTDRTLQVATPEVFVGCTRGGTRDLDFSFRVPASIPHQAHVVVGE
jgi:hypothetical protein